MLSNHPNIAAQLAAAHRDDLLRQADSRRLRRFARAARRAERSDRADQVDPADRIAQRADQVVDTEAGSLDEDLPEVSGPVIGAEPALLPGPTR